MQVQVLPLRPQRETFSSSSQPLQDAPEDVYLEDDYGNRYRREELPGFSDTELPQNHSYDAFSNLYHIPPIRKPRTPTI